MYIILQYKIFTLIFIFCIFYFFNCFSSQHRIIKLQDSSSDHTSNQERFGYFSSLKNVSEIFLNNNKFI